jgi:hypothetical protein
MTESQKAFDAWMASQLPIGATLPVHIYFNIVERHFAKIGFDAGEAYGRTEQATEIAQLKARIAELQASVLNAICEKRQPAPIDISNYGAPALRED